MLKQHNIFESSFVLSTFVCSVLISVHYVTGFFGIWYLTGAILVFCISVFVTFRTLRCLLDFTSPVNYKDSPWRSISSWVPVEILYPKNPTKEQWKEYDTSELSVITTVLERRLISSWYPQFVSPDIGFPFACKELLDHAVSKAFQITYKIDTPSLYTDMCAILVSHINEYKRAEKLLQLSKEGSFDQHYRLSHPISQIQDGKKNKKKPEDHCANILRVLLKDLTPFELWDTPHSELVIRILTKQVSGYIKESVSDPKWIHAKILEFVNTIDKTPHVEKYAKETVVKTEGKLPETVCKPQENPNQTHSTIQCVLTEVTTQTIAPILQKAIPENVTSESAAEITVEQVCDDANSTHSGTIDVQNSPVLRQRRGRQGKNEVKIYDRIIEGSVQTWATDEDLRCISVGQDLLAGLDGEISLSRLWEADVQDQEWSPNPQTKSPPSLWFGEENTVSSEAGSPPRSANDEAAGMMEGILDFGMAGLRKGLRLTGLHEGDKLPTTSTKDKSASSRTPSEHSPNKLGSDSTSSAKRVSPAPSNSDEVAVASGNNSHLVKQQRVTSQDSVPRAIPGRSEPSLGSPEPEYEEAADFASSIAKLRSLLQQHSAGDKWPNEETLPWEGIEETRGRQETRRGRRHQEPASLADEYDVIEHQDQGQEQSTNNMQRLDRLLQRTVTGVLNSIKTAVAGEGEESDGERTPPGDWQFVCTELDLSVGGAMSRLLASRRARAVDAAFDSLELAPKAFVPRHLDATAPPVDLEEWSCTAGACWGCSAELMAAIGLWRSHITHTTLTVLLGEPADDVLRSWLREVGPLIRERLFLVFGQLAEEECVQQRGYAQADVETTTQAVMDRLPGVLWVFGEATLRDSIQLLLRSVSSARVNEDLAYRLLDVYALHFVRAASA